MENVQEFSGWDYPAGNCLVGICPRGELSERELSGGELSSGELSCYIRAWLLRITRDGFTGRCDRSISYNGDNLQCAVSYQ